MRCEFGSHAIEALTGMAQPLRRAACLHTPWLCDVDMGMRSTAGRQATLLEGAVRLPAQPGAEGRDEYCRTLQHVLLHGAQPDALALASDGMCVSVDMLDTHAMPCHAGCTRAADRVSTCVALCKRGSVGREHVCCMVLHLWILAATGSLR